MIPANLMGPGVQKMKSADTGILMDVIAARGLVFSAWTPSKEEMEMLKNGLPVWLIQRGPFIPEMTMRIGSQEEVIPVSMMRSAISQASGQDPHEVAVRQMKNDIALGKAVMGILLGAIISAIVCGTVLMKGCSLPAVQGTPSAYWPRN